VRESAETKGRRYLTEGRLTIEVVDGSKIVASCRGGGELYRLGFDPKSRTWRCTCWARGRCAHLVALMLVVVAPERPS